MFNVFLIFFQKSQIFGQTQFVKSPTNPEHTESVKVPHFDLPIKFPPHYFNICFQFPFFFDIQIVIVRFMLLYIVDVIPLIVSSSVNGIINSSSLDGFTDILLLLMSLKVMECIKAMGW